MKKKYIINIKRKTGHGTKDVVYEKTSFVNSGKLQQYELYITPELNIITIP
jgi:hypothetical protein